MGQGCVWLRSKQKWRKHVMRSSRWTRWERARNVSKRRMKYASVQYLERKIVFEHFIHKAIFFFEKRNSLYLNRTATMARIPVRNMAVKTVRRITKSQQHTGFVFWLCLAEGCCLSSSLPLSTSSLSSGIINFWLVFLSPPLSSLSPHLTTIGLRFDRYGLGVSFGWQIPWQEKLYAKRL